MGNSSSVAGTRQKEPLVHEIVGLVMKNESSLQSDINGLTIGCIMGGGLSTVCAYYGRKSLFGISPLNSIQTIQGRLLKLFGSVGVFGFSILFSNDIYKRQQDYTKACMIANVIKPLLNIKYSSVCSPFTFISYLYAGNRKAPIHIAYVNPHTTRVFLVPNFLLIGAASIPVKAKLRYTILRLINPRLLNPKSFIILLERF